jgi:hypothetical protein
VLCPSQQSAGNRVRSLVCGLPSPFRQERLLLMLQGYFDDSGSDGKQVGFVLAGYVLPAELWAEFSDAWQSELKRDPKIEYFKMSEAAGGFEQFGLIPVEFRKYKVLCLLKLIQDFALRGITTNLKWEEFRAFNKGLTGPAKNAPYAPLFFGILDNLLLFQQNIGVFPHKTQLDFDRQGSAGRFALRSYETVMDLAEQFAGSEEFSIVNDLRKIMEGTPRMLDDKLYPPLQAADMLAWSLRLQMEPETVVKANPFAGLYEDIRKTVWSGCMRFSNRNWEDIANHLIRPVMPSLAK